MAAIFHISRTPFWRHVPRNTALVDARTDPSEALEAHGRGAVFTELAPKYSDAARVVSVDVYGEAAGLPRGDVLGAPTTWWGAPIAAVTTAG